MTIEHRFICQEKFDALLKFIRIIKTHIVLFHAVLTWVRLAQQMGMKKSAKIKNFGV